MRKTMYKIAAVGCAASVYWYLRSFRRQPTLAAPALRQDGPKEPPPTLPELTPPGPLASGSYMLHGRSLHVSVPPAPGRSPVLILLHANKDNGDRLLKRFLRRGGPLAALAESHVLVSPDGPHGSWNIASERSREDDAGYVSRLLLNQLAAFENVKPTFKLIGFSNGAALVNRILIECDDRRISMAVTDGSQLNTRQYRDGAFYAGGADNAYVTPKEKLASRALLQIVGAADDVCPAAGGRSVIGPPGDKLHFVPWDQSANAFARYFTRAAMTLAGPPARRADDDLAERVIYLGGSVQAINVHGGPHVVTFSGDSPGAQAARAAAAAFLTSSLGLGQK